MRQREEWMNIATAPVLELLALVEPAALRPADIHINLQALLAKAPSRSSVFRAVEALAEHGYVGPLPDSDQHYRVSDRGLDWLDGEIRSAFDRD